MKKDDIRTLIVIVVICVFFALLVILLNRKSNVDRLTIVTSRNMYFAALDYANIYLNNVVEENNETVYNLLDSKYIEKGNITVDNVFDNIETYDDNAYLKAKKMYYFEIDNNYVMLVDGVIYKNDYENTKILDDNFKIILTIDNKKSIFSVYPIVGNDYKKEINTIKKVNIKENENNKLPTSSIINEEQMCVLYMSDYVSKINDDFEEAYDALTDKMKEKYPSLNKYKNYVNKNKNKFTTTADKCRVVESKNDTKIYYVIDGNENEYTFYEDGIMDYKVEYYLK